MPIKQQKKMNSYVIRERIKYKESKEEKAQTFLHFQAQKKK